MLKKHSIISNVFIDSGNFGFGIEEHIDLGIKYDTNTGIFGMDFYVILARAGKRVAKRKHAKGKFGNFQRISADEAKQWFTEKCAGTIVWYINNLQWVKAPKLIYHKLEAISTQISSFNTTFFWNIATNFQERWNLKNKLMKVVQWDR